jgi:transposase-like zinc-binding protein/putative transposase
MTTMTAIFNAHGAESLARSPTLPLAHLKTLQALRACRTGAYGYSLYPCQSCGQPHRLLQACGNRHGPPCQHQKARQWLPPQLDKQLPGPYCLSTFPIPATLRPFCRSHPRLAYQAMFKASADALKRLARDARFLGTARPGFTGIRHTWGRQLQDHPHIHSMVPGGGRAKDRAAWLPSRANCSVPVKALSPGYRAIFKEERHTGRAWRTDRPTGLAHPLERA